MDRHQYFIINGWFGRCLAVLIGLCTVGQAYCDPPQSPVADNTSKTEAAGEDADAQARIEEWIVGLSSGEYATRRRAFLELWKQGSVALPAVRRALSVSDQQTRSAALMLENLLNLGISPADNDELAELLQVTTRTWESAVYSLAQKGYWRLAAEVLRSKVELLPMLRESYPPNGFCKFTQTAFEQGDAFQAWPLVSRGLNAERRFYLTELTRKQLKQYYNGAIPEKISNQLNIVQDESELSPDELAMYYLYDGRAQAAWDLQPSPRFKQRIIYSTAKWEWLKDPAVASLSLGVNSNKFMRRARQAAYSRMSGDSAASAALLTELRNELLGVELSKVEGLPGEMVPDLVRALILCGEGELVDDLISRVSVPIDLDYYTLHFQHAKVLKKFGLDPSLKDFSQWLEEVPGKLNPNGPQANTGFDRFENYLELTRFFVQMNMMEPAEKLYTTLIDVVRRRPGREMMDRWNALIVRSEDHRMRRMLLKHLDELDQKLKPEERQVLLVSLFPDWESSVDKIWQQAPKELYQGKEQYQRWRLLERLWRYDQTLVQDAEGAQRVETWLNSSLRESTKGEDASDQAISEVSNIALKLGLRRQALSMVRTDAPRNIFAVAEMLTLNDNIESAGKWWEIAVRQSPDNHMWIRRYADVMLMQGETDAAMDYELSIWLRPLTNRPYDEDDRPYGVVAEKYFDAGAFDLAQQYSEAAVELGDIAEQNFWSRRLITYAMEREDYATAARASRIYLLGLLASGAKQVRSPSDSVQYFQYYTGQELLSNAAHDIQSGRLEAALESIRKFESLLPSGIEICEHCYPLLVKAGHQQAADQLLDRCSSRMLKHLEAWPNDSNSHNNLAWMLARCNTRIPEALEHATKAVDLSNRSPTYVDTLAEAEYRAGNTERAIELARECIQVDPRHAHYQKQLQRFRSGK